MRIRPFWVRFTALAAGVAGPVILLVALTAAPASSGPKRPLPVVPEPLKSKLLAYLRDEARAPEDYVVGKFRDHDLVMIGEHHFIKHDVEFVQSLIPRLYEAGVRDLGIEFGCRELQAQADALVTADSYDEAGVRRLMFAWGSYWPYIEYQGLYRKAWELNKSLPAGAPKFRIVSLDYKQRFDLLSENMPPRLFASVWHKGPRDAYMARTIIDEFVKTRKKALVYLGQYHAFTRYQSPNYDFEDRTLLGLVTESTGNIVLRRIGRQVFQICLHYPWQTSAGAQTYDYPVGGVIDSLMRDLPGRRVGFDVAGSPFGTLGDKKTFYALGHKHFTFGDFCDGYVWERPFSEYEGCTIDPLYITADNLAEAIANLPNAAVKAKIKTRGQFLEKMRWDADFRRLYPDLD